ncbi:MAG TPA: hypothetical protein PKX48_06875 [Planctomycetota bacterium]|jgi:hypothetical protein|nr:hypothetical protein [Planctomycetota bacterium]OQC21241.1 MAG: hypothetical protein BWX69_00972 [Planctomycetes bacterium ADurb.Bin069]NMD34498.1 hypothetical protein [Planctomycetota bacterium]HNS00274.1 hypothetical protein [Planctomycetota bacterium]HNU27438.1 hypothetical protein [Planctomycetota bacterium]
MRTPDHVDGLLSSRRCFWVFVAIFSATVFCASSQIAARYCRYVETTQRVSLPGEDPAARGGVAALPERSTEPQPVRSHS